MLRQYRLVVLTSSLVSLVNGRSLDRPRFKSLVTFGDSYTDVGAPADGGVAWPVYAASYSNAALYSYAKSGATCSNSLTFRPFPSVLESQIPLYLNDSKNGSTAFPSQDALYSVWIGTNDLGRNSLLTGGNNASLPAVASCAVNLIQTLYLSGARNFIFQNMIPLEKTILYSPVSYPNRYWSSTRNSTEWNLFMREMVLSGNQLTKLLLGQLAQSLPQAHIAYFDSHSLFTDMYDHPSRYLNGTAPLNVTGAVSECVYELNGSVSACTLVQGSDRDSYLWYDELHPSEQAGRIVARQIADLLEGRESRWATWL